MKELTGTIQGNPLIDFTFLEDLIYYDGSLLSLFKNDLGKFSLVSWVDCDSNFHRWMIIPTNESIVKAYIDKEITLLDVIQKNEYVYLFDYDGKSEYDNAYVFKVSDMPDDYLPTEDSYYF